MLLSLPVKSISSYNLVIFSVLRTLVSQTAIIVAIVVEVLWKNIELNMCQLLFHLWIFTHLKIIGIYYYYSHFTDDETEEQKI